MQSQRSINNRGPCLTHRGRWHWMIEVKMCQLGIILSDGYIGHHVDWLQLGQLLVGGETQPDLL